jgi:hypothetical protein
MKNNFWHTTFMSLLVLFVLSLSTWAITGNLNTEQRITIFGIVGVVIAAITSVYSIGLNHQKTKEREIENIHLNELKIVLQHFYDAVTESMIHVKKNSHTDFSKKVESEMIQFKKGLMNWGSEKLIKSFILYDNILTSQDPLINHKMKINATNAFLRDIRKELNFRDNIDLNIFSIFLTTEARKELED